MKVVELGLQSRVYEAMKKPGFSSSALASELIAEGHQITPQSIRKFIRKTKDAQKEFISQDITTASEIKALTLDYSAKLKDILVEIEEVKNTARTEKDLATYNQLIGRLMQGIELLAKITGEIRPKGSVDVNIIYNEISNNMEVNMKDIRKEITKAETIDVDFEVGEEDKEMTEKLVEVEE